MVPAFNIEPEVVGEAMMLTAIAVTVVLVIVMVVAGLKTQKLCPAKRSGWRCVHYEDHPGSHRDENGQYWND